MPERPKGAVCKIAGYAYGGSNPPPPTDERIDRPTTTTANLLTGHRQTTVGLTDDLSIFIDGPTTAHPHVRFVDGSA
jgi:hypothetical protein